MPEVDQTDWSTIYSALAHDIRRELLEYLLSVGEARIEDVAHYLLDGQDEPAESKLDVVITDLYHAHLPKLAHSGLLTWDPQRNRIVPTALASRLPAETITPPLLSSSDPDKRRPTVD